MELWNDLVHALGAYLTGSPGWVRTRVDTVRQVLNAFEAGLVDDADEDGPPAPQRGAGEARAYTAVRTVDPKEWWDAPARPRGAADGDGQYRSERARRDDAVREARLRREEAERQQRVETVLLGALAPEHWRPSGAEHAAAAAGARRRRGTQHDPVEVALETGAMDFRNAVLRDGDVDAIVGALAGPEDIVAVDLSGADMPPDALRRVLAGLVRNQTVQTLSLRGLAIADADARRLAGVVRDHPALRHLDVRRARMSAASRHALARAADEKAVDLVGAASALAPMPSTPDAAADDMKRLADRDVSPWAPSAANDAVKRHAFGAGPAPGRMR